jgi:hypothetical protein
VCGEAESLKHFHKYLTSLYPIKPKLTIEQTDQPTIVHASTCVSTCACTCREGDEEEDEWPSGMTKVFFPSHIGMNVCSLPFLDIDVSSVSVDRIPPE